MEGAKALRKGARDASSRHPAVASGSHSGPHRSSVERSLAALAAQGRVATEVQRAVFASLAERANLLVLAPTGSGKTASVMLPLLARIDALSREGHEPRVAGVRVLYIAPVKALVTGLTESIAALVGALGAKLRVAARTGDTSSHARARMLRAPPEVLVVTPESLAVILATDAREMLSGVGELVLDEVHALASGKRGELLAATLSVLDVFVRSRGCAAPRRLSLSATAEPLEVLCQWIGEGTRAVLGGSGLSAEIELAEAVFDGVFPSGPWGLRRALPVIARSVASAEGATLVFVGSRARAEQWTLALRDVLPAKTGVACFHGSLSSEERAEVISGLTQGALRCVVATSALETGVDFPRVTEVVLLSAPASVTRLSQAAGRARHRPGAAPKARIVPTSTMDLVRSAALMRSLRAAKTEPAALRMGDLDVAVQAALSRVALSPCTRDELARCLRAAWPFRALSDDDIDRVLGFLCTGGAAFAAYPEMARVVTDGARYALANKRSLRRYLMCVGTIVGDVSVVVRHGTRPVGELEGRYASLLETGDVFVLGARAWRVLSQSQGEVQVRPERPRTSEGHRAVPQWGGSREARSALVSDATERLWGELDLGVSEARTDERAVEAIRGALGADSPNAWAVLRMLRAQNRVACVPSHSRFAVELVREKSRTHLVAFTFAGSMANEVIARVAAVRARRESGVGAEVAAHDEALCLTFAGGASLPDEETLRGWFSPDGLSGELSEALSGSVLSAAYFREVARISQLWTPERRKGTVTPGLLFDVLRKYDPGHLLLDALRQTLWAELGGPRAEDTLRERTSRPWVISTLEQPSPMAIPVFAWSARDAVAPADPEAALVAAAHALYQRTAGDDAP